MILMQNYMNGGCVTIVGDGKIKNEDKNLQKEGCLRIDDVLDVKEFQEHHVDDSKLDSSIETTEHHIDDNHFDKETSKKVGELRLLRIRICYILEIP